MWPIVRTPSPRSYRGSSLSVRGGLEHVRLTCLDKIDEPEEILELLQLDEMKMVAKQLDVKATGNRHQIKMAILATKSSKQLRLAFFTTPRKSIADESAERIVACSKRLLGPVVRIPLATAESLRRLLGLFFLDTALEENNLSTAILTDLHRKQYPPYVVVRSRPVFASREDWLAYDAAREEERTIGEIVGSEEGVTEEVVRELLGTAQENWRKHFGLGQEIKSYFLRRYTAGWIYTRILSFLTGVLERLKLFAEANHVLHALLGQDVYCLGSRGRWWERLVLNLHSHLGKRDEALRRCREGLADEHVRTGSRLALQRRLCKMSGEPFDLDASPPTMTIYADPEDARATGRKLLYLLRKGGLGSVEELVLAHFVDQGWLGFHCEGSIFRFLFALCFWDILFDEVPDVFQTPFHSAPLDLFTDAFYEARLERIQCRLEAIRSHNAAPQLLVDAYYPFFGCQVLGAAWREYPLEALLDICRSLGGTALAAVLAQLAEDYSNSSAGLPDLLLYRPDQSDYLLVEVKSTNDRLSDGQKNWNALFKRHGIKFMLCRVLDTSEQDLAPPKRSKNARQNKR